MADDPFALFDRWYAEARDSEPNDPNAMALATVDAAGQPSVRMVLLKGHGPDGFVFYTNREGRKAADLAAVPKAALLFHWKSLRRQIRIEGPVALATDAESDAYFASRGRDSQLGAWASDQSRPLADRATFEARFADMTERFAGGDLRLVIDGHLGAGGHIETGFNHTVVAQRDADARVGSEQRMLANRVAQLATA